ncbi:MAG: hypothetical protein RLN90_09600 [Balneolaceae bacterium]
MADQDSHNKERIERLKRITEIFQDAPFLQRIALAYTTFVRERTIQKNLDVNEIPFKDYSKPYARKRELAGLGSDVDLIFSRLSGTDTMMDSIDDIIFKDLSGVQLFFSNARAKELAGYHNIKGAGKSKVIRQFWGLSPADKDKLDTIVGDQSDDYLTTQL